MGSPSLMLCLLALMCLSIDAKSRRKGTMVKLGEENWQDILKGEWMIEFYAPWCPACKDLAKAWTAFADWGRDLDIKIAEVDVTKNPGLSGRFLVTALPTIYHVKDGAFRLYSGPRDKEDFISFIEDKKYALIEAMPGWKNPNSPQMSVMAAFFKLSMSVRDMHNYLVEKQALPPWGSYAIFAGGTLFLGCVLGFFIVCLIDCAFPSGLIAKGPEKEKKGKKEKSEKNGSATTSSEKNGSATKEPNGEVHANGKVKEDKKKK